MSDDENGRNKKRCVEATLPDTVDVNTYDFLYLQYRVLLYAQNGLRNNDRMIADANLPENSGIRITNLNMSVAVRQLMEEIAWSVKSNFEKSLRTRPDLREKYSSEIGRCERIIEECIQKKIEWEPTVYKSSFTTNDDDDDAGSEAKERTKSSTKETKKTKKQK